MHHARVRSPHGHGPSGYDVARFHHRAQTPPFFGGWGARSSRARRGDVRLALLMLLADEPRHGYAVIQEIEKRSHGMWSPSPGSIYPALDKLEAEGYVTSEEVDGKKVFSLTDKGRTHLKSSHAHAPWEHMAEEADEASTDLRDAVWQLGAAAKQVGQAGSDEQKARAAEIVTKARKELYGILAE